MCGLSIKHINYISRELSKSGITYSHLLDDLIDHVCCDVENEMKNGTSFEIAYRMIRQKISIDELRGIQDDTLYLIDKNYRIMKKTMKVFGVLSPVLVAFGTLFKIEHWPASGIIFISGFFFLSFVFLPSAIYVSYKEISNRTEKWTYFFGFFGFFFLSLSFLFKVQHWPGASILLLTGILLICVIFLPVLLISKMKKPDLKVPKYVFVLAFTGFILYLFGFNCKILHWSGANLLLIIGTFLFLFVALPIYVYKKYSESRYIEYSFIYIIIVLAWFIVPTSLLSINSSRNILHTYVATGNIFNKNIQYLQQRNNRLLKKLPGNSQVSKINSDADALITSIQLIKVDMIKQTEGNRASAVKTKDNEFDMQYLSGLDNTGACLRILQNGRAGELSKLYETLRNDMLSICDTLNCRAEVSGILPEKPEAGIFSTHATAGSLLNNLSFLQLNILQAENIVFAESISHSKITKPEIQISQTLVK